MRGGGTGPTRVTQTKKKKKPGLSFGFSMKKRVQGSLRKLQNIAGPTMDPEAIDDGLASLYSGLRLIAAPDPIVTGLDVADEEDSFTAASDDIAEEQDLSNFDDLDDFDDEVAGDADAMAMDLEKKDEAASATEPARALTEDERRQREERRIAEGVEARIRRLEQGILRGGESLDLDLDSAHAARAGNASYAPSIMQHARGNTAADRFVRRAIGANLELDAEQVGVDLEMYRPRSESEIIKTLPEDFYNQDFDAIESVLKNLPPREECSNYEGFLQTDLSEKDIAKDHIVGQLGKHVRANSEGLVDGETPPPKKKPNPFYPRTFSL
mmetsp:Transcript_39754/g.124163  ORF Transcript_39754/g.124163 Transcript_39754/m.124163 type:complete len:326 (-) Transcript_39754:945-1922(-)